MSLLDLNLGDIPDLVVVEPDEYELRVLFIEQVTASTGKPMISARFEILGEPNAAEVYHNFMLPTGSEDERQSNNMRRRIRQFFEAFDIDFTATVDLVDVVGLTGWAILGERDDEEYGKSNTIRRWVTRK